MLRIVGAILLATLAMYSWGFFYWGINPLPYYSWKNTSDDEVAGEMLSEHFPEDGVYFVPGFHNRETVQEKLFLEGPVAFVFITAHDGRPMHDMRPMMLGLLLYLAVNVLIAMILLRAAPALPTYRARVTFALLIGFTAAVMVDLGDAVWWGFALDWKLNQLIFNASAFLVSGLVLGRYLIASPQSNDAPEKS